MCQMCDEYENELVRMGLIADARKFREEREAAHKGGRREAEAAPGGHAEEAQVPSAEAGSQ